MAGKTYLKEHPEDKKRVEEYLRTCCSACEGSTADFINSLAVQWGGAGWLSEKQFYRLKQIYDNL